MKEVLQDPLVTIRDLVKRYDQRMALDHLNLTVNRSEILGLLGPNGAGKSTIMSILATLLAFDEGEVRLDGQNLKANAKTLKSLIGWVPQELALYNRLSARDNLHIFGSIYGIKGRRLADRAREILSVMGLASRAHEPVMQLSGGMQRRINIGAALMHDPELLLLDEPTVGVDPQSRNFIFEYVEQMRDQGKTIIYSTHYMEEAQRLCNRLAIIDNGRIVTQGDPQSLLKLLGDGMVFVRLDKGADLSNQLSQAASITKVTLQDGWHKIETADLQQALRDLLAMQQLQQSTISGLKVLEPNLESVFLHLTGKSLRDEE